MKKSFKSKAINAVLSAIVRTVLGWVEEWGNDAYFFLIIGDKNCTDVAWYNSEQLACDGALAVSDSVETAGVFATLSDGFNLLVEDKFKDENFTKTFEMTAPSRDDHGWISYEEIFGGKAYTEAQQKGGAQ